MLSTDIHRTEILLVESHAQRSNDLIAVFHSMTFTLSLQKKTSKSVFKHSLKKEILGKYSKKVECRNPRCTDQRYHV